IPPRVRMSGLSGVLPRGLRGVRRDRLRGVCRARVRAPAPGPRASPPPRAGSRGRRAQKQPPGPALPPPPPPERHLPLPPPGPHLPPLAGRPRRLEHILAVGATSGRPRATARTGLPFMDEIMTLLHDADSRRHRAEPGGTPPGYDRFERFSLWVARSTSGR